MWQHRKLPRNDQTPNIFLYLLLGTTLLLLRLLGLYHHMLGDLLARPCTGHNLAGNRATQSCAPADIRERESEA